MATVPFSFDCVKESGFIMDPNEHKAVGYVTAFTGINNKTVFTNDMTVSVPWFPKSGYSANYAGTTSLMSLTTLAPTAVSTGMAGTANLPPTAKVVGVIEKFEYEGGVGSPIKLDFWVSQANATNIKSMQQSVLETTIINALGWWIIDYDQETKCWYEKAFPQSAVSISGIVTGKENPALDVDLAGAPVKDGIDVMVYKVHIEVAPAANLAYQLAFANSPTKNVVKSWGLVVGSLASTAVT